jgi:hypothetical protein
MTEVALGSELPVFSECVLGYRAWRIDRQDRLWPISDHRIAWEPGINVARCNCAVHGALAFDWSWRDGRRVLEPHPLHDAPGADCTCGLYSWRRPRATWARDARFASGRRVCGAVASWGRIQVHGDGFRAEKACVVTLAYPRETAPEALATLERVAARYGVELVALDSLEEAASRHGSPLPDQLRPDPLPAVPARPSSQAARAWPPADGDHHAAKSEPPERQRTPVRERVGIGLGLVSAGAMACGSLMWLGRGPTAMVGLGLLIAGCLLLCLITWWLQPHGAAKRAIKARDRRLRERSGPAMTDAEFDAVEDALDHMSDEREPAHRT